MCSAQMDQEDNKAVEHKNGEVTIQNGLTNVMCMQADSLRVVWQENVTVINLSSQNIVNLDDTLKFPPNLLQLNLSHNKLIEVPGQVLNLEKLVVLNLSHNKIEYFDDCPIFCHTLKHLDMSYNHLAGPPYWIWTESPRELTKLYLGNNPYISNSFINGYFEELLQYSTLVTDVDLQNCRLNKYFKLLSTFPKAESICLGANDYKCSANSLIEIPCQGLDECCDLKRLIVCNTHVYTISPSIEKYKNLVELNLAFNDLNGLPNEFCSLKNLETCVLSGNKLLYLPENIHKLEKLIRLYLDGNELCMLPDTICELSNLKTLDLYDNHLNEVPNTLCDLDELDLALNYFEEPEHYEYLEKKEKLRLGHERRFDGRKHEINNDDEDYYEKESEDEDDEELYEIFNNREKLEDPQLNPEPASSPEDWDSDEYWVPFYQRNSVPPAISPWLSFVKQKMKEGNFCPMDAHPVSVVETVRYQKLCNPQVIHESDGQFDDYSSDDS